MERTKKLKTPAGNVHDIRYLLTIVASLKRREGRAQIEARTLAYFQRMINDYNYSKSTRYGLFFKPRKVNIVVVRHVVSELKNLNLIQEENQYLKLTDEGRFVASLIEQRDTDELKKIFTRLMLENYYIFEYFLEMMEASGSEGIPIPFITSKVFSKFNGDPEKIGERYINAINERCPSLIKEPYKLHNQLRKSKIDSIAKRTDKIKKLQSVIEKYVVSEVFQPHMKSRRVYDFVRSRTTFLGLTNYARYELENLPAEVTYLISGFAPTFPYHKKIVDYSGGTIYINSPSYEEIRKSFKESLIKTYKAKKDEFGYMKIADARDAVCRDLRVADNLFDLHIQRLYEMEPNLLSFTYLGAEDKITEKRLPILFERRGELFTRLKINMRR